MLYKEILKKNYAWLRFIENLSNANTFEKNYYAWLIYSNKEILKKHVDIISPYKKITDKDDFFNLIMIIIIGHKQDQLIKKNLNKVYRGLLVNLKTPKLMYDLFILIGEGKFNNLIKPNLYAFSNPEEFNEYLNYFICWHNKWNKTGVLSLIKEKDLNVDVSFDKDGILILEVNDFNAAKHIGTKAWCISREERYFDSHKNVIDKLFFVFNFNKDQYDKTSLIGVTIPNSPIIRFKYSFNNANETYKDISLLENFKEILYKEPFDVNKFKNNVSLINDPYEQFIVFFDMEFYEDADFLFAQFLNDARYEDYFLSIINYIVFEKKNYQFIYNYIENNELNSQSKFTLTNTIGELISEMHHRYNDEFMKRVFLAMNDKHIEINFLRKMVENEHTSYVVKALLRNTIKEPEIEEYVISYAFKIEADDKVLRKLFEIQAFTSLKFDKLYNYLSAKELSIVKRYIKLNYTKRHQIYIDADKININKILDSLIEKFKIKKF